MNKKYHAIYKTTNLVNGKFYYGIHSTNDLNDGYIGSGRLLTKSINKHGRINFDCQIIEIFDNRKDASNLERVIVTNDLIQNKQCYNLRTGGDNEFISPSVSESKLGIPRSDETKRKIIETLKEKYRLGLIDKTNISKPRSLQFKEHHGLMMKGKLTGSKNPMYGKTHSDEVKKFLSENNKGKKTGDRLGFEKRSKLRKGKKASEETRNKMSLSRKGTQIGIKNTNAKSVVQLSLDGQLINTYLLMKDIPKLYYNKSIRECCKGLKESYHGFIWRYKKDYV